MRLSWTVTKQRSRTRLLSRPTVEVLEHVSANSGCYVSTGTTARAVMLNEAAETFLLGLQAEASASTLNLVMLLHLRQSGPVQHSNRSISPNPCCEKPWQLWSQPLSWPSPGGRTVRQCACGLRGCGCFVLRIQASKLQKSAPRSFEYPQPSARNFHAYILAF